MKKHLQSLWLSKFTVVCLLIVSAITVNVNSNGNSSAGCSDAGTASATEDSVCYNTLVTLSLSGYTGTIFQWQSNDGTGWINETGPGATTAIYDVTPANPTSYRAIVTEVGCPEDTSNIVIIEVGTIPVPSASSVTRCGPGYVDLIGSGTGTMQWFTSPAGGTPFATGSPANTFIPASTTVYVSDNVLGGSGNNSPILITEMDLGNSDYLEIQNVSPQPVDVTGWKVAISDSYSDINIVNSDVQILSGTLQPGDILTWTDLTGQPNYWGSNMFWNPGSFPTFTGWAIIIDDQNNLRDFVPMNWPDASIQSMAINIQGAPLSPGTIWTGDGVDITSVVAGSTGVARSGTSDNDDNTDFQILPLNIGSTNSSMTLPFTGFGCSSPRIPVQVTITPSDSITINASTTALCLSGSANLSAVSANGSYNYTWSPATGLSGTTGPNVTATPLVSTTYVVIGDDGTCSNVDSVTILVGAPTVAGTASTFQDTICINKNTDLILTGHTGTIQWQSFDGTNWVNETGFGSDSAVYNVSPVTDTDYRAFVTSGSCDPDSSNTISIIVLSITDPVTSDTAICGPGNVTLNATGPGVLSWYTDSIGGTSVNQGSSYSFTANQTTTVYVEAFGGTQYNIGPANPGFGNQSSTTPNNTGMSFDVLRPITLDIVHIYPAQSGTVTVNLRQTLGGPILATYSQAVTAFSGKIPLPVGFSIPVGTGYRLELQNGGPQCQQNTTGATYPYTVPNGPLQIMGYVNPNFGSGGIYLYFYDWIVAEGCRSLRVPATVTVNSIPPVPTIIQQWNVLTSSAPSGNQWLLNGVIIPGATGQDLVITQTGTYTVAVTVNGCTSISAPFVVTVIGVNEIPENTISVYPNPVMNELQIKINGQAAAVKNLTLRDISGRIIYSSDNIHFRDNIYVINTSHLSEGIYSLEMSSEDGTSVKRIVISR